VKTPARAVLAAVSFLTRVPTCGPSFDAEELAWAPAFFPLVGLLMGMALAGLRAVLSPLGSLADATLVVGASLWLTRALHEDGLADAFDALGGAVDRDRVFEILKDSRVGTFGASALVVSIVGRIALVDRLGHECFWALPLVSCASRVGPVWQMVVLPYVSRGGAKSVAFAAARLPQALAATAIASTAAAAVCTFLPASASRVAAMVAVLVVVTVSLGRYYGARLGGITGDLLGATEQVGELAALSALAWGAR
jgi:adenosylcobinamide-GDP ribazoletransferase